MHREVQRDIFFSMYPIYVFNGDQCVWRINMSISFEHNRENKSLIDGKKNSAGLKAEPQIRN
jgi:hypothetical protein